MAITASGIGSNLDVNGIVSQLMAIEQQPLKKLDVKEASYQAKLTALGTLKGSLSALQTAVGGLTNTTTFQTLKATSSDATVLSASAVSTATAGSYSVEVSKLAQAQVVAATGQSSLTTTIGSGTLTFDFGSITGGTLDVDGHYSGATFTSNGTSSKTVTIDSSNNTLSGIRDAINAANIGINATIVNDGGTSPYRLVLSSTKTGADNSIKISVSGDAALSNLLAHDPEGTQNLSETVTAQNAELKVNGIAASKNSNTITDVIHGVTLKLVGETTSPITVDVANDNTAIATALNAFVQAYNDANSTLKNLSSYDATTQQAAILQGDFAVRTIQTQLRAVIGATQSGVSGDYTTLSQIGLSFQKDGSLALDSAKLQSAISSDPDGVNQLVVAAGKSANSLLSNMVGTGGAISAETDGINRIIKDIDNQRINLNTRLISIEKRYRAQFSALDTLIGSMTQTSNFLTQQLANLPSSG